MANAENITSQLQELIAFIESVTAKVDAGLIPDLNDLDNHVESLCGAIEKLDKEQAQDKKPLLGEMINRLDMLAESLAAYQDKVKTGKSVS